jgi:hypothetical protein
MLGGPIGAVGGAIVGGVIGWELSMLMPHGGIKPGGPKRSPLDVPTADEGLPIPDLLGTSVLTGNFLWYGYRHAKKLSESTGGGKGGNEGGSQVVGYRYFLTWAMGICSGPVDKLYTIWKDDKILWHGQLERPETGGKATIVIDNYGSIDFFFGTGDQVAENKIGAKVGPDVNPPYTGLCYAFFNDCRLGTVNRVPALKFAVSKRPGHAFNGFHQIQTHNYNPAHAIYYILTTLLGLDPTLIDNQSFSDIADALYLENRGISIVFDKADTTLNYIETVLMHIDAGLRFTSEGKIGMVLFRDDIPVKEMLSITEDQILDAPTLRRKDYLDTENIIKVNYPCIKFKDDDEFKIKFKDAMVAVRDMANIRTIGVEKPKNVRLELFTNTENAGWAAHRILRESSHPLATISLAVNRIGFLFEPGDRFGLFYLPYNLNGQIFRVTNISEEGIESEKILIEAIEDPWYVGKFASVGAGFGLGNYLTDPALEPIDDLGIFELPYIFEELNGSIGIVAKRANAEALILFASNDGETYEPLSQFDFGVFGLVQQTGDYWYPADTKTIDDDVGFEVLIENDADLIQTIDREKMVEGDNLAILQLQWVNSATPLRTNIAAGYECISFQTITPLGANIYKITGIQRGMFGTKKKDFPYIAPSGWGEWRLAFLYIGKIETYSKYVNLRKIIEKKPLYFKAVPVERGFIGSLEGAREYYKIIFQHSTYPIMPGTLFANGAAWSPTYPAAGDVVLTWRTSDRRGTAGAGRGNPDYIIDNNQTYEGKFYIYVSRKNMPADNWVFVRNSGPIDDTTWTYTIAMNTANGGGANGWAYLKFEINSAFDETVPYVTGGPALEVRRV